MKLWATILVALAAALAGAVPAMAVPVLHDLASAAQRSDDRASVTVRKCRVGDTPRARTATFYGRMRAVPGTSRMSMRFLLQDRSDSGERQIATPALRPWRRSRAGVQTFGYAQRIAGLEAGGAYSVEVEFRWHDARGKVLRRATRESSECRQRGDLANLAVGAMTARRGEVPGTSAYAVDVRNTGSAVARGVEVEVFVDGVAPDAVKIGELAPGETRTVRFTGPSCRRRVRAVVDRRDSIHETTDDDNVVTGRCPAAG